MWPPRQRCRPPLGTASGVATTCRFEGMWCRCSACLDAVWAASAWDADSFSTRLWACGRTLRLEFDCSPPGGGLRRCTTRCQHARALRRAMPMSGRL